MKKLYPLLLLLLLTTGIRAESYTLHVSEPGTLKDQLVTLQPPFTRLTITGALNDKDVRALRLTEMTYLDISGAAIEGNRLEKEAFARMSLDTVILPSALRTIGESAFNNCDRLEKIVLPQELDTIGVSAFFSCDKLSAITLPPKLRHMGKDGFLGCSSLASVAIPAGITILEQYVFFDCTKLKEVLLPEGLTTIGSSVFYNCQSLTEIHLPQSLTTIGESAFSLCSNLASLTLPRGVRSIGPSAFNSCIFQSILLPEGITTIENRTFVSCYKLKSIVLPGSLTTIRERAFSSCRSLKTMTLPAGITTLDKEAFNNITLDELYLSSAVPPAHVDPWAFNPDLIARTTLYVPTGMRATYQELSPWDQFWYIREWEVKGTSLTPESTHKIYSIGTELVIEGPVSGSIRVYSLNGTLLHEQEATDHLTRIALPGGTYVVVAGETTRKIIL